MTEYLKKVVNYKYDAVILTKKEFTELDDHLVQYGGYSLHPYLLNNEDEFNAVKKLTGQELKGDYTYIFIHSKAKELRATREYQECFGITK